MKKVDYTKCLYLKCLIWKIGIRNLQNFCALNSVHILDLENETFDSQLKKKPCNVCYSHYFNFCMRSIHGVYLKSIRKLNY